MSILDALAGAGGGGGGGAPSGDDQLAALQSVIQDLHTLISVLTDPQATAVATQCLAQLTKVQSTMMQGQQGSPQQAIGQRLQSGGGAGPAY